MLSVSCVELVEPVESSGIVEAAVALPWMVEAGPEWRKEREGGGGG